MEYLVDAKKMKQCDQAAIEELGISVHGADGACSARSDRGNSEGETTTGTGACRMRFRQ